MSGGRELDVVVFGATGFIGRLVAGYLADHAPDGVRIGLAGRSAQRLADLRARLGAAASAWPLLVADSADPAAVAAVARAARVVATTVGPYRRHGLRLVEACASAGTDYADLSGEVLFIRESIDRCHDVAAGTGTRIVHCCGFDSVPSDLLDWVSYDSDLGRWVGPFLMAGLNTRVVRRSNALQDWAYGRRFRYREVTGFGTSPAAAVQAAAFSTALRAAAAGLAFGPSRALLGQLLPVLGEGPSEKTRRTGIIRMQIHTRTPAGVRYLAKIEARGDPGYAATSVMLGESALCLALDRDRLPDRAGVLTPATAMGAALADRLRSAGHTLAVRRITP